MTRGASHDFSTSVGMTIVRGRARPSTRDDGKYNPGRMEVQAWNFTSFGDSTCDWGRKKWRVASKREDEIRNAKIESEKRNTKIENRETQERTASEGRPYKSEEKSRNSKCENRKTKIEKRETQEATLKNREWARSHAEKRRAAATKAREKLKFEKRKAKHENRKAGNPRADGLRRRSLQKRREKRTQEPA